MAAVIQYIQFTPEDLAADRKALIAEAIAAYKEATKEHPVSKRKIMEAMGWADRNTFDKYRRAWDMKPVDRDGNVSFWLLSDWQNAMLEKGKGSS